jgi:prepilin-type N-terminal cleavage/methylation domain-containing protein
MDYLVCREKRGFTLVEMIVVLSITILLIMTSDSIYTKLKSYNNLKIATGSLVEAIRYAQTNSQTMKDDSTWGVKILSSQIVIFKGLSYATRDIVKDQPLDFPPGISSSGLDELVFSKMNGWTINTGTIVITNDSSIKNILINEKGTVTY